MHRFGTPGVERRLWAKSPDTTPYPLIAHLLDTAVMAGVIWDRYLPHRLRDLLAAALADGDHDRARSLVMLAAGLHDLGKANPVFQLQAADPRSLPWREPLRELLAQDGLDAAEPAVVAGARGEEGSAIRRHEYVGYLALNEGRHPDASDRAVPREQWLSVAVSGHHGRWHLARGQGQRLSPRLCDGAWGACQQDTSDRVLHALDLDRSALSAPLGGKQSAVAVVLVTGLVILADWLVSDEDRVAHGQRLIAGGLAAGCGRDRVARVREELVGLFVHAHHRHLGVVRAGVDVEDVFHPGHELAVGRRRDGPALLQMRAKFRFFNTRPMVE